MNAERFVQQVIMGIVDEGVETYQDLFESTDIAQATDPYWKSALAFFHTLDDEGRKIFFRIIRQVSIDTLSHLFAVLDGVSTLGEQEDGFRLTVKDQQEPINGNLQDLLLGVEEEKQ